MKAYAVMDDNSMSTKAHWVIAHGASCALEIAVKQFHLKHQDCAVYDLHGRYVNHLEEVAV